MFKKLTLTIAAIVAALSASVALAATSEIDVGGDPNNSWDIGTAPSGLQLTGFGITLVGTLNGATVGTVTFGAVTIITSGLSGSVYPVVAEQPLTGWTFSWNFPNGTASGTIGVQDVTAGPPLGLSGLFTVKTGTGVFADLSQFTPPANDVFTATFQILPAGFNVRDGFMGAKFQWGTSSGEQCTPGCIPAPH